MTEQTQPTDAELLDAADDFRSQYKHGGTTFDEFDALGFARAVLAKWGTPPAVAGEPVAYRYKFKEDLQWQYTCNKSQAHRLAVVEPLYTTPQPTQAQAGAVPLTCEWAHNEDDGFWDTECGQSWRFDDGGPKENHMNFCHCCGKPLRIKGGQS